MRVITIFFFLTFHLNLFSQTEIKRPEVLNLDTIGKKDTVHLFSNIKKFASNRKFTNWLYCLIFKDPNKVCTPVTECYDDFCLFQGKKIRNIRIIVLDPFGTEAKDTIVRTNNFLEKLGNGLHTNTQQSTVRNLLLFKKGEPLDSLKIMESERILRQSSGISDAEISILNPSENSDSTDILIIVRDLFSITGSFGLSPKSQSFTLTENNFLGLSHILRTDFIFRQNSPQRVYGFGSYTVNNISNSLISGVLYYSASSFHKNIGISFERSFITPLIKWAGGISYGHMQTNWPFDSSGLVPTYPLTYQFFDTWVARSFNIIKYYNRSYNDPKIILAARYYRLKYFERPSFDIDYTLRNQSASLYLGTIALSIRGYYKDINIYRFDRIEDVPEGRLLSLTMGYETKEFIDRPYVGLKFAAGQHVPKLGYLAYKLEYGTFLNKGKQEQGVFQVELNYLTDLLKYKKWSVREFISYRFTSGINRQPDEFIDIAGDASLSGFDEKVLLGTNRAILKFMTVIYLPYKFIGFQFAPTIFAKFGTIGDTPSSTFHNHVYQSYGLGVLMRNEYLAFNTIQFSFNYFPRIPNKKGSYQKLIPVSLSVLRFIDYAEAKPEIIKFL